MNFLLTEKEINKPIDEFIIEIQWDQIKFSQDEAKFVENKDKAKPLIQTICNTHYKNTSNVTENTLLKIKRSPIQKCNIIFTNSFNNPHEGEIC